MDTPTTRYLQDAIAAEKSFETQLLGFAEEVSRASARELFEEHAAETRAQYEGLTVRLEALGEKPSALKSFMAHVFNMSPKLAQLGHSPQERTTQDLMMAFSVENAEVAMYEALIMAAESTGDRETVELARQIQQQEKKTAEKVWSVIAPAAEEAFIEARAAEPGGARPVILRYLQDAEAAERNFEDALATFSKVGGQEEVQNLMATMSDKARTQHQRLRTRIESLGGTQSTSKSVLAHLLAFTPVTAQLMHTGSEKSTQHLMITYAAAAAEMAMYESLAAAAAKAGDQETVALARQLQTEEKEDHRLAWNSLSESAREALQTVSNQF
jgi:ferritin-like metal-binding protein YciE